MLSKVALTDLIFVVLACPSKGIVRNICERLKSPTNDHLREIHRKVKFFSMDLLIPLHEREINVH